MTVLSVLVIACAIYLALFLVKLPQICKVVAAATDHLMVDPAAPARMGRKVTFSIGLVLSFFTLGKRLRIEGWQFFNPYTKRHLDAIRRPHQVKK